MKALAINLAIFLLIVISTNSPIFAINLVTSNSMINLEAKLLFLINHILFVLNREYKDYKFSKSVYLVNFKKTFSDIIYSSHYLFQ